MFTVSAADLRAFVQRDFARVERAKREYWQREYSKRGARAMLDAADALEDHVRQYAGRETPTARSLDLAHHVHLKQRIDAANRALDR